MEWAMGPDSKPENDNDAKAEASGRELSDRELEGIAGGCKNPDPDHKHPPPPQTKP
jgi:hypothetical protein